MLSWIYTNYRLYVLNNYLNNFKIYDSQFLFSFFPSVCIWTQEWADSVFFCHCHFRFVFIIYLLIYNSARAFLCFFFNSKHGCRPWWPSWSWWLSAPMYHPSSSHAILSVTPAIPLSLFCFYTFPCVVPSVWNLLIHPVHGMHSFSSFRDHFGC